MRKVLLFLLLTVSLGAQQELGTYFFSGLHQSAELNPAFDASHKIVIGLPSAFVGFHQRGISVGSFLKGQLLDVTRRQKNQIMFGTNLSVLKVSYKHKNIRYNLAHNYRSFSDFQFTRPLLSLLAQGNANLIGGKVEVSPNLAMTTYSETVLGAAYVGDFSFGANLKLLNGIQNISSARSAFDLSVNDDIYQLEMNADFLLNSSFPVDFNNINNIDLLRLNFVPRNFGVAFDFGLSYKNGPFSLAASAIDVGYIRWNQDPHNYQADGQFVYEGISVNDVIDGDFNFLDTIGGTLVFTDAQESYTNYVPTKFYANLNYQYMPNVQVGALFYAHSNYQQTNAAVALNIQRSWNNRHAISGQYAIVGTNPLNFGISGYTTFGPLQIYGIFDNVLGMINTLGAENSNFRIGMNLVFRDEPKETRAIYAYLD